MISVLKRPKKFIQELKAVKKTRKFPEVLLYSFIFKTSAFTAVKRDATRSKLGM